MWYRLEGHTPVKCDVGELPSWDGTNRRVAVTELKSGTQTYSVSTVFLSYDINAFSSEPHIPVLFETMVFVDEESNHDYTQQRRYHTWDEAEAGHAEIVANLKKELGLDNPPIPMGRRQIRGS